MILEAIKFCRFKGQNNEWAIEGKPLQKEYGQPVTFENINLIVGKNASGKTRTIDVIRVIADLISGDTEIANVIDYSDAIFELWFKNNSEKIYYLLEFKDSIIIQEYLEINGTYKLDRKKGDLYYQEIGRYLSLEMESDVLVISKINTKQQPFFEPLYNWAKSLNHYRFGTNLGRDSLYFGYEFDSIKKRGIDLKTNDKILLTFIKGKEDDNFEKMVIDDMLKIGYHISEISYSKFGQTPMFGLSIKENDIAEAVHQVDISQGMFRVLSLLIQLNYSLLSNKPSCILIDDIGEGLDFERAQSLIKLVMEKVENSTVQVIMTTNDRFVMNNIPLKYWSVIHRISKKSLFYNYRNSKEIFDEFNFTGLSNFDFLAYEYYYENLDN